MKVIAYNPSVKNLEKSYLSSSIAAGVLAIAVKNADRFGADQMIMIGAPGRERTEIIQVDQDGSPPAVSTTTINLATETQFPHDADDPVYVLDYDKVRIYRSTTGENGVYSLLATVDIDADNEDDRTYYEDTTGLTTYFYKVAYYHSVDAVESDQTDPIPATGYDEKMVGTVIAEVANEVKDPDFLEMSIDAYISHMNSINDDLITQAKRSYRFLRTPLPIDVDANDSSFPFPDDLWKINYIEVNEATSSTTRKFRPKKVSATEARHDLAQQTLGGDYVTEIAVDQDNNLVLFVPKARVARLSAFTLFYYKFFTRITSFSDRVETPNTLVYKLGLKREFYMIRADDDDKYLKKAMEYDKKYNAEVMKLQREKNVEADGPSGMGPDKKRYNQWGGPRYRQ